MNKLRRHLSFANVASATALFVALGGGAYALSIGKDAVKSRQIAAGAVRSSEVKNDSLKGRDVAEQTLKTAKFTAAASVPPSPPPGAAREPIKCDPEVGLTPCGEVALETPTKGRILGLASGEMHPVAGGTTGACSLFVDRTEVAVVPPGAQATRPFSVSGLSEVLPAGAHRVSLQCDELLAADFVAEIYAVTAVLVGGR